MSLFAKIKDVLVVSQKQEKCSSRYLGILENIFKENNYEDFKEAFYKCLKHALHYQDKCIYIERLFKFICTFVCTVGKTEDSEDKENVNEDNMSVDEDEGNDFLQDTFIFILSAHRMENPMIRFHVCKFITMLLDSMDNDATIDDELYDRIKICLLCRLQDKVSYVRVQAAKALPRLQDPSNKQCPIIERYIYHLNNDPVLEIREAILDSIATSSVTILPIITRTRDIKDTIRKKSFECIANRVMIKCLTISQRLEILNDGFNDRNETVRNFVREELVFKWLKQVDNNVVEFISLLDIQMSSVISRDILEVIFEKQDPIKLFTDFKDYVGDSILMPYEKLTPENAFYWHFLCVYLKKQKTVLSDDILDFLLPPLNDFCDYMRSYTLNPELKDFSGEKQLEHQFVSEQLLGIAKNIDLADQFSCKKLIELTQDILLNPDIGISYIKPLIACFIKLYPNPRYCLKEVTNIVIEHHDTISKPVNNFAPELNLDIAITLDETEALVETREEENPVILKCLTILAEALEQLEIQKLTASFKQLIQDLIWPGIKSKDPHIRNQALRALGICCLFKRKHALSHMTILIGMSQCDHLHIRVQALKVIFDIFLRFGKANIFAEENYYDDVKEKHDDFDKLCSNKAHEVVHKIFLQIGEYIQKDKIPELQTVVVEGFCKLLFTRRIHSPLLLSKLILVWFSPDGGNYKVKQILSVFFCKFTAIKENLPLFEGAFMPTLKHIFSVPPSNPLSELDPYKLIQFFMCLGEPIEVTGEESQENVIPNSCNVYAYQMATDLLRYPKSTHVKVLIKALGNIHLSPEKSIQKLLPLADRLLEEMKVQKKHLEKFKSTVQEAYDKYTEKMGDEMADNSFAFCNSFIGFVSPASPKEKRLKKSIPLTNKKAVRRRVLHDTTVCRRVTMMPDEIASSLNQTAAVNNNDETE